MPGIPLRLRTTGLDNVDLLAATDDYVVGRERSKVLEFCTSGPMLAEFKLMCKQIRSHDRHRDSLGVVCQNGGCDKMARPHNVDDFKYCSRCKQVMYCSEQCHSADWPSHKKHCSTIARMDLKKRELLRLPTALSETMSLMISVRHWARVILKLDDNRQAGLKNRIVFTCTLAPRGADNADIVQITRVEIVETPETLADPDFGPLAQDRDNVWIQLEFRSDVPGMNTAYRSMTRITNQHLWMLPMDMCVASTLAPVAWLTNLNKGIRDDEENMFGLRVIRSKAAPGRPNAA